MMVKKNSDAKGKQFGFWFYTGDWLKDPELRFCSIFARGLLVDLLCFMFESKERGYLVWPDGSPRTNEEIADAVSGGDRIEKLEAIAELERKGVLSRDSRGVLFSRRMARLGEISQTRSEAGSKGGSKTQAKAKQTDEQTGSNRGGVSVSVSVSDNIPPNPLQGETGEVPAKPEQPEDPPPSKPKRKPRDTIGEFDVPPRLDTPEIRQALADFETMRLRTGKRIKDRGNLCRGWDRRFVDAAHLLACIECAISNEYQGISPDYITAAQSAQVAKPSVWDRVKKY